MSTQVDIYGLTVTITGSGPYIGTRSDGLTVSNNTIAGLMGTFDAMAPSTYVPPAQQATLPMRQFLGLLTTAQRTGLWGVMVSDTGFADAWWQWVAVVAANGGVVNPATAEFVALLAYCVTKSYLTQTQANELTALTPG